MSSPEYITLEPKIMWTKYFCPMCKCPSGTDTKCETLAPPDMPVTERLLQIGNGYIDIFSKGCHFRNSNFWKMHINFPLSEPLREILAKLPGVEKLEPLTSNMATILINKLFNEKDVQSSINHAFTTFIKSKQAEIASIQAEEPVNMEFPNKKQVLVEPEIAAILKAQFGNL